MSSPELLSRVREELSIPDAARASSSQRHAGAVPATEEWRRLHHALAELEANVLEVGEIPKGYPRHVDWVMRALHALLPWYTRPLRRHAEHTTAVCRALRDVVGAMMAQQAHTGSELPPTESDPTPGAPRA